MDHLRNVLQPRSETIDPAVIDDEQIPKRPKKLKRVGEAKENVPSSLGKVSKEPKKDADVKEFGVEQSDDGWDSGTVADEELEEDDGWESGSIIGEDEDDSADESDNDEEELAVEPPSKKSPKKVPPQAPPAGKASALQSTFLPSLSVGFTRGESDDSDLSDSEVRAADIDIKKNRRGQRARRA